MPHWLSIISYPTRAHGIIVKYTRKVYVYSSLGGQGRAASKGVVHCAPLLPLNSEGNFQLIYNFLNYLSL